MRIVKIIKENLPVVVRLVPVLDPTPPLHSQANRVYQNELHFQDF